MTPSAPKKIGVSMYFNTLVWSPKIIAGISENIPSSSSVYPEIYCCPWSIMGYFPTSKYSVVGIFLPSLVTSSNISRNLNPLPQVVQLVTNASENIPCLSFDTKDKINVAVGDSDIIRFENLTNFNI